MSINCTHPQCRNHYECFFTGEVKRWGFKSKTQLPLFMMWTEYWVNGEVEYAQVTFNTYRWWERFLL